MPRNTSEVRNINQNGRLLLEMCKSIPVRILNGRTFGDTNGNFTRYPIYNSQNESQSLRSVIDYALADPSLFTKIKYFSVSNMTRFSDHCIIKLSLKTNFVSRKLLIKSRNQIILSISKMNRTLP